MDSHATIDDYVICEQLGKKWRIEIGFVVCSPSWAPQCNARQTVSSLQREEVTVLLLRQLLRPFSASSALQSWRRVTCP
jgi:hypothetical protein